MIIYILATVLSLFVLYKWLVRKGNKTSTIIDPNSYIQSSFKRIKQSNILNISKYEDNCFDARCKGNSVENKMLTTAKEKILNDSTHKHLYENSVFRSCFATTNVKEDNYYSYSAACRENYVYRNGVVYSYNLEKDKSYTLPFTKHYYSQSLPHMSSQSSNLNANLLYIAGMEAGEHLAALENKLFLSTLLYHKNTTVFHDVKDSISAYKAYLDFKEKKVNQYILLLPDKDPYSTSDLVRELKQQLGYEVCIYAHKVPDLLFNLYKLRAVLLEKTQDLKINLVQRGSLNTTVVQHKNLVNPYLELMYSYSLVFSGLSNVSLCFEDSTVSNEILDLKI